MRRTRLPAGLLVCACVLAPLAQAAPPAGSDWSRVRALQPGTRIHVAARQHRRIACDLLSVSDTDLSCLQPRHFFVRRQATFARDQVLVVSMSRTALSSVAGAGLGAGVGVAIGVGVDQGATRAEDPNLPEFTFGILGGIVGMAFGSATDFLSGPVIYRAP